MAEQQSKSNTKTQWSPLLSVRRNGVEERAVYGAVAVAIEVAHNNKSASGTTDIKTFTTPANPRCYGRSLMKPFQMKPLVKILEGALDPQQKALAMASHFGTAEHLQIVRTMLPVESVAHRQVEEKHPCSGKHSAILTACQLKDWPPDLYLSPMHTYNKLYASDIEQRLKIDLKNYTLAEDGCGLPTWAIELSKTAELFIQLAEEKDADWVWSTFRNYPQLIGGEGRLDTQLMTEANATPAQPPNSHELIAKEGADGLLGVAISSPAKNIGIVMKLAHGYDTEMMAQVIYPILNKLDVTAKTAPSLHRQQVVLSDEMQKLLEKI